MPRIASIDYGLARLGLALSDETKMLASPLDTLRAEKSAQLTAERIAQRLSQYELEAVVIGMPLHLSGKQGFLADEVTHFISLLEKLLPCPIIPWDERLTSVLVERAMIEGNVRRKKRAQHVDTLSAVLVLQNYLDSLSQNSYA